MRKLLTHLGASAMFWLNPLPPYFVHRILHVPYFELSTARMLHGTFFAVSVLITLISCYYLQPETYGTLRKCLNMLISVSFIALFALPLGIWSAGIMWGIGK